MEKELEIEYKNILTINEYQKIMNSEFLNSENSNNYRKITQTNHYFDTEEQALKKQKAALRIRITNTHNELTFKVPSQGFLMETNKTLTNKQVNEILTKESFTLNDVLKDTVKLDLKNITNKTLFLHFNSFETVRFEKKVGNNLMVLDQTTFQNGAIDYELEVESTDPESGKNYIQSILERFSIPKRRSFPKIARAEEYNQ